MTTLCSAPVQRNRNDPMMTRAQGKAGGGGGGRLADCSDKWRRLRGMTSTFGSGPSELCVCGAIAEPKYLTDTYEKCIQKCVLQFCVALIIERI